MKARGRVLVGVTTEQMVELRRICPEGCKYETTFDVWLPTSDRRYQEVISLLDRWGYKAWDCRRPMDYLRDYDLCIVRQYEPADFEGVEYAEFWPELVDSIAHSDRDEQGRLRLERPTLKNAKRAGLDFAHTILKCVLVQQKVRDLLLEGGFQGGFRHLVFRPTVLVTGRGTRPERYTPIPWEQFKVTQPWWELSSDLVLPPLSGTMDLRDDHENPVRPGDCSNGCRPREGVYNHAELRYRRADLTKVDAFDVAMTFEPVGLEKGLDRRSTIVSKRFYDFCQEKGLRGRWAPVRIEEG